MPDKGSTLIFFTDTFPCGSGEAFIENEFPFLAAAFEKVIIVTNNLTGQVTRPVSSNTKVTRFAYAPATFYKAVALAGIVEDFVRSELDFIRKQLKLPLSRQILSTVFGSYAKALEVDTFLGGLIKQEGIDTGKLYLYSYWMNDMAFALAYFKYREPSVRAFCRAHRWDIYLDKQPLRYLPFRNFITRHLDAVYSISDDGANYLKELTQHRFDDKIKVARLGTVNAYNVLPEAGAPRFTVLSCSSLIPRKRLHLIIEGLALIDDIELEWVHIGDGPERPQIEALAKEKLAGKNNVSYVMKGQMSNARILEYYATHGADLFINVSESEGVPVSIMEANSFGIPAIATNTGGVSELVGEANGFLLDVNASARVIADAIIAFHKLSSEARSKMRMNAFNTWAAKFNAEQNYMQFVTDILALKYYK